MQHHHVDPANLRLDRTVRELGPAADRWPLLVGVVGLVAAVVAAIVRSFRPELHESSVDRFFIAYLHNFLYFLTIVWGALFFVLVQHLTRAGWSVTVRRVAELVAASVWVFALLFLPILVCVWLRAGIVFPWSDPAYVKGHLVVAEKIGYFNVPGSPGNTLPLFFTLRAVFYFAVWFWLGNTFFRRSLDQDATGDPAIFGNREGLSAIGILLTFLTVTFASIDWAMSLDPEWFSTMFGVYTIAGSVLAFLAALWVFIHILQSRGLLLGAVTVEHQHDIGKLQFGFVIFWAYITFCQYLLIWYGDIPEETHWYWIRQQGGWPFVGVTLIVAQFIIPFFGLLSRHVKRNRTAMLFWSCWLLALHWVDLYYIVMPAASAGSLPFAFIDLFCFLGIGGLWLAALTRTAVGHPLVPLGDPRLHEALAFHNS